MLFFFFIIIFVFKGEAEIRHSAEEENVLLYLWDVFCAAGFL